MYESNIYLHIQVTNIILQFSIGTIKVTSWCPNVNNANALQHNYIGKILWSEGTGCNNAQSYCSVEMPNAKFDSNRICWNFLSNHSHAWITCTCTSIIALQLNQETEHKNKVVLQKERKEWWGNFQPPTYWWNFNLLV